MTLLEWFAHEHGVETAGGAAWCRNTLERGAGFVEPAEYFNSQTIDYLIGKSAFLNRYDPQRVLEPITAQHVGFAIELDDHQTAVIALRRMTARGA